jgi:hypothetical protein
MSLPPFKRPRALSQGNPAPHASDFPFLAPVRAQSLAGVDVCGRRAPPPQTVPSGANASVSCLA